MYPIHLTVYGLCMNGKNFPIFSEIILASDIFWNFYFRFTNKIYTHRNLECICLVRNNEFIVMYIYVCSIYTFLVAQHIVHISIYIMCTSQKCCVPFLFKKIFLSYVCTRRNCFECYIHFLFVEDMRCYIHTHIFFVFLLQKCLLCISTALQ